MDMRRPVVVLVALLVACPLFAWPETGYDAVRLPAVLLLAAALMGATFLRAARGAERPPGPAPLRTAGVLLLGVHALSLLAARSWADAAVPILVLFAGVSVYCVLREGVLPRQAVAPLLPLLAGAGLLFAGIGIVQHLRGGQAVSTEGNRNYAGALAAMLLCATVPLTRTGPRWSRALSGGSAAALLALLLLTESRGGLIAAVAGLLIAGVALWAKRVDRGLAVVAGALVLLGGLFGLLQARRQVSPDRMETAGLRLDVWKSGLRMVAERPILGWGAGGFAAEYPRFRSESEFGYSHRHVVDAFKDLEDAHSSWVQIATETGIPGLLALLLVVYVAARLWRYYVRTAPDGDRAAVLAGLGGAAAAYLVAGLFNTLTVKTSHTMLFWVLLGLIELVGDDRPRRAASRTREWRVAMPAAAAFVALFGALWAGAVGKAEAAFLEGMSTNRASLRETRLRESLDTNPFSWRAHYELALTLAAMGRFVGAADEGRATLHYRPFHLDALNHTAISLIQAGGDPREIEALFRRAVEVAPYYYKTLHNFGQFERMRGNRAEARTWFTEAIERNPTYVSSYFCRGMLSYAGGESDQALEDLRKAQSLGFDVASALRAERSSLENDARLAEFFR